MRNFLRSGLEVWRHARRTRFRRGRGEETLPTVGLLQDWWANKEDREQGHTKHQYGSI